MLVFDDREARNEDAEKIDHYGSQLAVTRY